MNGPLILITGDREWNNIPVIADALHQFTPTTTVLHGNCRGADLIGDAVAREMGLQTIPYPAHWHHNDREWVKRFGRCDADCERPTGRPAGVLRNGDMLKDYAPSVVLAFHDNLAASTGTLDMIRRARKAKLDVHLYDYTGFVGVNPPTTKPLIAEFIARSRSAAITTFFEF